MLVVVRRGHIRIDAVDDGRLVAGTVDEVCVTVQHGLLLKVVMLGSTVVSERVCGRSGLSIRNRAHARRPRAVTVAIHRRRCRLGNF